MRKLLAILLPFALLLTACGGSDASGSGSLDEVKVTAGAAGKAPKVEFPEPLELAETEAKVINEGEGEAAVDGQWLRYRIAAFDAISGEQLQESFTGPAAQTLELGEQFATGDPVLYEALKGVKPGADVAYYLAPTPAETGASAEAQQPVLLILTVERVKDKAVKAEAAEISELDKAGKLPEVSFDKKGVPSVKIPEGAQAPDNLIVKVLEEGDGKAATAESTVKANYTGWNWAAGKQFDSSFERGEAAEFALNGVIEGWTKGLTGLKEGSKVMLSIPTEMAYVNGQGDAVGDLIFYVELTEVK